MTLGELSKKFAINRESIRFYERQGLLPRPKRNDVGYRIYDAMSEKTLSFILKAKNLGFTLAEIKSLLSLRIVNTNNCGKVKSQTLEKINEIEEKINYLRKIKLSLEILTVSCSKQKKTSSCPIIENLEN